MSRPNIAVQRNLTLTEELEKLEQSITLTLQGKPSITVPEKYYIEIISPEIDHNFSRAHRIVTTSILPIVENYAEHSKNVWEGSKVRSLLPSLTLHLTPSSFGNNSSKPPPTSPSPATKNPQRTTKHKPKTTQRPPQLPQLQPTTPPPRPN